MSEEPQAQAGEPSEEEVRAALEAELRRISVDDVLLQTAVSLINLAGRRTGLAPGTEGERDLDQVRVAIEGVRALLPLLEPRHADKLGPLRDALSQLQLAYAKGSGEGAPPTAEGADEAPPPPADAGDEGKGPGPAQSSGRLWTPGR
jgi:hypothetical protein